MNLYCVLRSFAVPLILMAAIPAAASSAAQTSSQPRQQLSPALEAAVGRWQVIDEQGKDGGQVETYVVDGRLSGKVIKSRPERPPNEACTKCPGKLRNEPVLGMIIIRDFRPHGDVWAGGTVLDPKSGRVYHGKIWMAGPDRLRLRGFVAFTLFGRTETWTRLP